MGFFDFFKAKGKSGKFVTDAAFRDNLSKQISMSPQTVAQLREMNVQVDMELKLEYFFYTNSESKARQLSEALQNYGYTVEFRPGALDPNEYVITGWTTPILMSEEDVVAWTKEMCGLGYQFDCEFDGWGTNPDQ